jgi:hypothetical protein
MILSLAAGAQEADSVETNRIVLERSIHVVTGGTIGKYSRFLEVGVAKSTYKLAGHHSASSNIFASVEMKIDDLVNDKSEEKFMIGPKIGAWIAGGAAPMAMGANMIYYTDFTHGTLVFRPEIGFGYTHLKIVYGYNISLTKRQDMVDRSVGSIFISIGVKKLKNKIIN